MECNSQPLISIVVPIFNVEAYLAECIESVLQQGKGLSYEIILVDDGSTDQSAVIARSFAQREPKTIRLFEQSNQGVAQARNAGILHAKGKYLMFLDSDDVLESESLRQIVALVQGKKGLDILVANFNHISTFGERQRNKSHLVEAPTTGLSYLLNSLKKRKFQHAIWNKVYRRSLLLAEEITFRKEVISGEDLLFSVEALLNAKSVVSTDLVIYGYRHRESSVTQDLSEALAHKRIESHLTVSSDLMELTMPLSNYNKTLILERLIKLNLTAFRAVYFAPNVSVETKRKYIQFLDGLKLYRFVRFSRISHVIDWVTLRMGFGVYTFWRKVKW